MINKTKTISCSAIAAAGVLAALPGAVEAQTATAPVVGVDKENLIESGVFNLVDLGLHEQVVISGSIDSIASNDNGTPGDDSDDFAVITENNVTLTTPLGATGTATYVLEITSGSLAGVVQEVSTWTSNTLTIPQDLASEGLVAGTTYKIRPAATIASVFGATNTVGLLEGTSTSADQILIPDGVGGFDFYYYSPGGGFSTEGWRKVGAGDADFSATPIIYTDAIFVNRRGGSNFTLTQSGEVSGVEMQHGFTVRFRVYRSQSH